MIKARIRVCTCRVENILTLGKLLSLWFCFLLHSILFFISQTSYRRYKIIGERAKRARHSQVCTIENRDIYIIVRTYVTFAL